MSKKEKILKKFDECVAAIITERLVKVEEMVSQIENDTPIDTVAKTLEEANSLISFACGEDDALYEEYRYRFIIDENERYWILQGREIGVDPRDWSGKKDPEE